MSIFSASNYDKRIGMLVAYHQDPNQMPEVLQYKAKTWVLQM